jgi:hypothetical protein
VTVTTNKKKKRKKKGRICKGKEESLPKNVKAVVGIQKSGLLTRKTMVILLLLTLLLLANPTPANPADTAQPLVRQDAMTSHYFF